MDPGRKRSETREAQYVAVGETINLFGVLWEVESIDGSITFSLTRQQGDRTFTRLFSAWPDEEIIVRNHLTPQS